MEGAEERRSELEDRTRELNMNGKEKIDWKKPEQALGTMEL